MLTLISSCSGAKSIFVHLHLWKWFLPEESLLPVVSSLLLNHLHQLMGYNYLKLHLITDFSP